MAISRMNFRSEVLGKGTSVNLFLPDSIESSGENNSKEFPVIYLLHGWSDDCNAWLNATSLERYASDYPFIIVMPQVELSFYTDMYEGEPYWTYLTIELPKKMEHWYHISSKPEKTFVAGLSMGGYGAFKWALQHPERFKASASLSGALDVASLWKNDSSREKAFHRIFGSLESFEESDDNLYRLLDVKQNSSGCHFIQICGTEDFLYENNTQFRKKLTASPFGEKASYFEKSGDHNWAFWDEMIQRVLKEFSLLLA